MSLTTAEKFLILAHHPEKPRYYIPEQRRNAGQRRQQRHTNTTIMRKTMLKRIFPILLILISLGMFSCSKSPSCKGRDENKGIIEKYYHIHDFPMCVEAYVSEQGTMVIRSEEELSAITDSNCINLPEAGYSTAPPEIDFSQHSLLGFWVTGGGCDVRFIREVNRDDDVKKYVYKIKVIECGLCDMLRYDANFVLLPAIPGEYKIEFSLDE